MAVAPFFGDSNVVVFSGVLFRAGYIGQQTINPTGHGQMR
jgi:hypothetical protein